MDKRSKYRLGALAAGLVNGAFGGGGGIPLAVALTEWAGMEEKRALASCVAVILPVCAVTAGFYFLRAELSLAAALPYLVGGLLGGFVGGKLFARVRAAWLRKAFALFLLYGGARYLFGAG